MSDIPDFASPVEEEDLISPDHERVVRGRRPGMNNEKRPPKLSQVSRRLLRELLSDKSPKEPADGDVIL